jgi:DNA-binding NtrC family response regulator
MKDRFEELVDHLMEKGFFLEEAIELLEKTLITRALASTEGNQCKASKMLGIHRNTLQRKMVEYDVDGKHPRRKPPISVNGHGNPAGARDSRRKLS